MQKSALNDEKDQKTVPTANRPLVLSPLFRSIRSISGIGPRTAPLVEELCGTHIKDLLFHIPTGCIDRQEVQSLKKAENGRITTLTVTVISHTSSAMRGKPYKVKCEDMNGDIIDLIFFQARKPYVMKLLPPNEKRIISGRIDFYQGMAQMVHPDHIATTDLGEIVDQLEPTYPLTKGISQKILRKTILSAIKEIPPLAEWHDDALLKRHGWQGFEKSLAEIHRPTTIETIDVDSPARRRLAYDEIISMQLALSLTRYHTKTKAGRVFPISQKLRPTLLKSLPFSLTDAQQRALKDIDKDSIKPDQMLRLLQGDVGSGKTVVALIASLNAIETGAQVAFMAPTEILARQHFEGLKDLCDQLNLKTAILTSREKGKKRTVILDELIKGETHIIFGTHALFQDTVIFKNLGFVVIDEQHRFGVHQRLKLSDKGIRPDILSMTATPIPRTLALTAYGDMDVSRIDEKPAGRQEIDTRVINLEHLNQIAQRLKTQIDDGAQAYWVCPLVEESEKLDLAAAQDRYTSLKTIFSDDQIGLIHGKMKGDEKDAVMKRFAANEIKILIATTVIEVGVNVPNATIMVIEHAERFGLSQLHQLRGRIGRGHKASTCLLLYTPNLGETAKKRLDIMRQTNDGFLISERDMEIRGSGDVLGTQQSGLLNFKIANIFDHKDLIEIAHKDARLIVEKDPNLETKRGQSLKILLYLFERDQAIQYLRAG